MKYYINTMKRIYMLLCLLVAVGCSQAQTLGANTGIPPYHILTTDSVYVTPANLKKDKPVMVIYFAPDCGHCQHLMYDLKPQLKNLKDVQIVMITFVTQLKAIQVFQRDFDLAKYHNITIGTEGYTYLVQKYYQIKQTPYIAIYNRNGKLSQAYEKVPTIPVLMSAVKKV
jgi:thiol-disulfide isomerase/thioredoxin